MPELPDPSLAWQDLSAEEGARSPGRQLKAFHRKVSMVSVMDWAVASTVEPFTMVSTGLLPTQFTWGSVQHEHTSGAPARWRPVPKMGVSRL
jgi:hypothetical protein